MYIFGKGREFKYQQIIRNISTILSVFVFNFNERLFFIFLLQNNLLARRTGTTDQFAHPTNQTGRPGRRALLFV
jgi:hypothetical protein